MFLRVSQRADDDMRASIQELHDKLDEFGDVVVRVEGYPPFYGRSYLEALIVAGEHGKRKVQS